MRKNAGAFRVGAVPFVNARPLTQYIDPADPPPTELALEVPSKLTLMMQRGSLDAALLPSIEYFRGGAYRIIPGASISADGIVESVRIFSKTPPEDIRFLALDESSRTSAALTRIILKRKLGMLPDFTSCSPDADLGNIEADAMLLIGDSAMACRFDSAVAVLDLGEEWKKLTGLPFVYAMWVVQQEIEAGPLQRKLVKAREKGLANLPEIAAEASRDTGLALDTCRSYLENTMSYELGEREIEALRLFQELAAEDGLCEGGVEIVFSG